MQRADLPHEREENSGETDDSESEPWYYKSASKNNEACGKPHAGETAESSTAFQKSQKNKEATVGHSIAISPQTISYTEAVYDIVRKIHGRPSDDPMEYLIVNMALW